MTAAVRAARAMVIPTRPTVSTRTAAQMLAMFPRVTRAGLALRTTAVAPIRSTFAPG
jgi:hypothetical protein